MSNFSRVLNFALTDFARNKGVSIATIFVLVVTISLVSGLFFFRGFTNYLIFGLQDKMDITAYFKDEVTEEEILAVKDEITGLSADIKDVQYISKEKALEDFEEKHKDNDVYTKALQEVGANPFLPSLSIKTSGDPEQYEEISNILQSGQYSQLIDSVDFTQKKDTIEKVYEITKNVNLFGYILSAILIIIAVLVVYNTTKLAVDTSKDEIGTMKLVGASNWFIRGPFVVQGAIFGIIAFVICIILSTATVYLLSPKLGLIMPGFSLADYFISNLWVVILIQLGFGAGLGMLTSYFVVKKYLKN